MPWYKFWARHGKGHMGYDEEYKFYPYEFELNLEENRESLWEEWIYNFYWNEHIEGDVEEVGKLPDEIRQEKIEKLKNEIKEPERTLRWLEQREDENENT